MLKINVFKAADHFLVTLEGVIDETSDFKKGIGDIQGIIVLNCAGITRINSMGVKKWVQYFGDLSLQKKTFRFTELSPVVVEQFNIVKNFGCGGTVESIKLPYRCEVCNESFTVSASFEAVKKAESAPKLKCPKCQGSAEFDEVSEEYFQFAKR